MRDLVAAESGKVRVLVVEDSEDQAGLLRRYFERAGCDVTVAESAEDAILAYREDTPELAIVDLQLPGMDGWELTSMMQLEVPSCPIAISSVRDSADFPETDAVLPKPFTGAQVRSVLRSTVPRWVAS
jgi:DNA-binding response OmpR family regulator